ncbi:peroxisomal leader peptide-processing protease [Corythoichthys intestinalis]|uniref:peroxisomal leader peptide-processing protease n=1 Tax=Corythoichthys intestinalis TaxID=161448 RepID=UPI0025A61707|nr:peroxisomal leader peptide-processing protease [Corythoichthys intestinalis]XP_061793948.1 peroxisomal leader peptide-processing protease-like [Nerophis lumbriciformis]
MELQDVEKCCGVVTLREDFSGQELVSFSGILIHPSTGAVICIGLPFFRLIIGEKTTYANERRILLRHNFRDKFKISVSFPSSSHVEANACRAGKPSEKHGKQEHEAELLMLVNCVEFKHTFQALFHQADKWCFHGDQGDDLIQNVDYLSWFAVLKVGVPNPGTVSWCSSLSLQKGSPVVACGSPFGSLCLDLFNGTVSRGIISNLAGEDNAVILTDARCLPGTEGGGLFAMEDNCLHLIGVIVSPFGWKANEWIGLTLVCSIHSILGSIAKFGEIQDPLRDVWLNPTEVNMTRKSNLGQYPIVCLVDSGQRWGSGVLVTSELILTCRHVVDGKSTVGLKFHHRDRVLDIVGDVLFSTKASSPYDVAVVRSRESIFDVVIPRMAHKFNIGECVLVSGYGGLGQRCGPSVSCGVLSKAITFNRRAIMLQTTCAVQAGTSGGPVVRASTGELLGIVCSNTRDLSTKATYPHLNFCIPMSVLHGPLLRFEQFGDIKAFDVLDAAEEQVKRVWRLQDKQSKL